MKGHQHTTPQDPFVIIYDHRRAKRLKKMRDLRNLKIKLNKEELRKTSEESKIETLHKLNKSMLLDERDWHYVQGQINMDISIQQQLQSKAVDIQQQKIRSSCHAVLTLLPTFHKSGNFSPVKVEPCCNKLMYQNVNLHQGQYP